MKGIVWSGDSDDWSTGAAFFVAKMYGPRAVSVLMHSVVVPPSPSPAIRLDTESSTLCRSGYYSHNRKAG
ncbi:hypothetical protein J6590_021094 [Homalodisca vitripennis]|nr:hypothetical protein J6590_021094 [Homalodisca vitripennis]